MKTKRNMGAKITIIIILFWSLIPIYWALRTSLLTNSDLMVTPIKYLPSPLSLENYKQLFGVGNMDITVWEQFKQASINSFISCIAATIIVVIISTMAGYAFARLNFKGKKIIFGMVIATMALPAYSVMIPLYRIMIHIGLLDTHLGIISIYAAAFAPLAVWIMRSSFNAVPVEIEEAALIDGASRVRAVFTILPLALPGMIAVSIITFLSSWSQFMIPLVFTSIKTKPLTVLITEFVSKSTVNYGLMSAAGIITILPPVIIVIFLNKYLIDGLMSGAVKK